MERNYLTERLILNRLTLNDTEFIYDLVNTPEWIKFIGDRNVKTEEESKNYVQKIINNLNVHYWVVKLKSQKIKIGVITLIKRDYLDHHDIGFAFLPKFAKNGYAYEASIVVLNDTTTNKNHQQIFATTVKENTNSIKLLEKLGLRFEKIIENGKDSLMLYAVTNNHNCL